MAHVFVSYSKKNRDYARKLADHLLANGFDVWIDDRIDFGSNWEREIFKAVDGCDAIIVIMTPESYESIWVQRERQYAENRRKQAFPLLLDGEAFPFYVVIQYYDVRGEKLPEQNFLERLANFAPRHATTGQDVAAAPQQQAKIIFETSEVERAETDIAVAHPQPVASHPRKRSASPFVFGAAILMIGLAVGIVLVMNPQLLGGIFAAPTTPTLMGGGSSEIAFVSDRDGNRDIYVMNIDGSNPRNLTNSPAADSYPNWSPDGTQIVFMSEAEGENTIINIMDADGGNVHQLGDRHGWHPAWSPDGGQIAFADSEINSVEIFVVEPDGSNLRALTDDSSMDGYPTWSPDGTQIAFITDRDGDDSIHIMDADGGNIHTLTNEPERPLNLAWSPDGRRIAFQATENGNTFLFVIDVDGSNLQRLTPDLEDGYEPAWSPDGTQIAFMSYREENGAELYILDTNSRIVRQIVWSPAIEEYPAWRP